jgi:GNAT superfamily N-acetyltransferase
VLEEHPLDPAIHDRAGFSSGVPVLDEYLARFAAQHRRKGIGTVYVLTDSADPRTIIGYYTLSAAQIEAAELSAAHRNSLPRYPIPCFRMGRLTSSRHRRGTGMGRLLVGLAVTRCLEARKQVAAFALIVDAKDDAARKFYEHYGFTLCVDTPMTLYLPLG